MHGLGRSTDKWERPSNFVALIIRKQLECLVKNLTVSKHRILHQNFGRLNKPSYDKKRYIWNFLGCEIAHARAYDVIYYLRGYNCDANRPGCDVLERVIQDQRTSFPISWRTFSHSVKWILARLMPPSHFDLNALLRLSCRHGRDWCDRF